MYSKKEKASLPIDVFRSKMPLLKLLLNALLAQLEKRRSAEWEVAGSNPGRTNTQGL